MTACQTETTQLHGPMDAMDGLVSSMTAVQGEQDTATTWTESRRSWVSSSCKHCCASRSGQANVHVAAKPQQCPGSCLWTSDCQCERVPECRPRTAHCCTGSRNCSAAHVTAAGMAALPPPRCTDNRLYRSLHHGLTIKPCTRLRYYGMQPQAGTMPSACNVTV